MSKNFFVLLFIFVILVIITTGIIYFVNAKNDDYNLNNKAEDEIKYIGKEIINMTNALNNMSFDNSVLQKEQETLEKDNKSKDKESQNNEIVIKYTTQENGILNSDLSKIDWEYMKNNSEILYMFWTRGIIDLHSLNIDNQDILDFSKELDQVMISVKNEDKINSLISLTNLYSFIPKYMEKISNDKKKVIIENTKLSILNSYVFMEQNNWNGVKEQTQNAIRYYSEIINSVDENSTFSQNKVTKIYVLLNELNNSIDAQNKDVYYIKYKNTMQELVNI